MKKLIATALSSLFCFHFCLHANETTVVDITQFSIETMLSDLGCGISQQRPFGLLLDSPSVDRAAAIAAAKPCLERPFGVLVNGNYIGKAPISGNESQGLYYANGQAEGIYGIKLAPDTAIAINLGAGVDRLHWSENPYFNKQYYPMVNVGISGYTLSIRDWIWMAGLNCQYDTNNNIQNRFTKASRYGALLWGRYTYSRCLGLHFGVLVFTGIRKTNAYPILGFDYNLSQKWKFNAIFPINMAVIYSIAKSWSLSLAGRPFIARHRLSNNQPIANGIFEYRNYGAELSLNYDKGGLFWQIYGGYSFGGTVKTEDSNGNALAYTRFDAAPYVGLNVLARF